MKISISESFDFAIENRTSTIIIYAQGLILLKIGENTSAAGTILLSRLLHDHGPHFIEHVKGCFAIAIKLNNEHRFYVDDCGV